MIEEVALEDTGGALVGTVLIAELPSLCVALVVRGPPVAVVGALLPCWAEAEARNEGKRAAAQRRAREGRMVNLKVWSRSELDQAMLQRRGCRAEIGNSDLETKVGGGARVEEQATGIAKIKAQAGSGGRLMSGRQAVACCRDAC